MPPGRWRVTRITKHVIFLTDVAQELLSDSCVLPVTSRVLALDQTNRKQYPISLLQGGQAGQVELFVIHTIPSSQMSQTRSHVSGLSMSGDGEDEDLPLGAN